MDQHLFLGHSLPCVCPLKPSRAGQGFRGPLCNLCDSYYTRLTGAGACEPCGEPAATSALWSNYASDHYTGADGTQHKFEEAGGRHAGGSSGVEETAQVLAAGDSDKLPISAKWCVVWESIPGCHHLIVAWRC